MQNKPCFASCLIHIKAIPVYNTHKSQAYNKAPSYFRKADCKNQITNVSYSLFNTFQCFITSKNAIINKEMNNTQPEPKMSEHQHQVLPQ